METLLTPDDVAKILRVKKRSVYELCSTRGQKQPHPLPFCKVANKLRFSREAVMVWVNKLQERAA